MALKHELATKGSGATSSATGMVLRSIRKDLAANEKTIALIQGVGEFLYGVDQLSDLSGEQMANWVKRSNEFAEVQGDLSGLLDLLGQVFEEAREDDKRLLEAELKDLEDRFTFDARIASREQRLKEKREAEERERDRTTFYAEIEGEKQSTEEKAALLAQGLKERETKRKLRRAREVVLICVAAFFAALSGVLIVYGVLHEEIFFVGGSAVSATVTLGSIARLAVRWEDDSSQGESSEAPEVR